MPISFNRSTDQHSPGTTLAQTEQAGTFFSSQCPPHCAAIPNWHVHPNWIMFVAVVATSTATTTTTELTSNERTNEEWR